MTEFNKPEQTRGNLRLLDGFEQLSKNDVVNITDRSKGDYLDRWCDQTWQDFTRSIGTRRSADDGKELGE